jgi:hypothetical protein
LTDTDSDNLVSGSKVVTITATFSEPMTASPTISITGEISNAVMTVSTTANVWNYPWTVSTTTSGIVSATVSGVDIYGKTYAGTDSITFTIDNSAPTLTLTDTDSDNLVSASNLVTITATFSEAMSSTPTINISGQVSSVLMTASSTTSIWIYPWTVNTFNGQAFVTVSGSDTSGKPYTGTDSITFKDLIPPNISGATVQAQNNYVDITFDQPIYGNANATSSIASSSFSIVQTSGSSLTLNILGFKGNNSTTFSSASQLSGGETTVRIFMDLSSLNPVGSEVYSISATSSSSIFDINGRRIKKIEYVKDKKIMLLGLQKGVFILKIQTPQTIKKLIIN